MNRTLLVWLFGPVVFLGAAQLAAGQGAILIQHSGATDPTSEGFSLSGAGVTGPVLDDMGVSAWIMQTTNGSPLNYLQTLTPIQQSEIGGANWDLSATVRSVQYTHTGRVQFSAGPEGAFFLNFGVDTKGDPTVSVTSDLSRPTFVLTNRGSTYNTYQLLYEAADNSASLWVNGVREVNNIKGDSSYSSSYWGVDWGESQSPFGMQANWNSVFLTTPEPSPAALLFLGSGVLFYLRRKVRR